MQHVYSTIYLISVLLLSGCSSQGIFSSEPEDNKLPSLLHHDDHLIIQVAANFDSTTLRDHPYFIICKGDDCPVMSLKTPTGHLPFKAATSIKETDYTTSYQPSRKDKNTPPINNYRVHFEYANAELSTTYKSLLKSFVDHFPHHQKTIRITGFTDSGSKPDATLGNEWLALERALSVKHHLMTLGYPESKILLEAKFLCCYLDSNETEAGRRNNRRAELTLLHHLTQ